MIVRSWLAAAAVIIVVVVAIGVVGLYLYSAWRERDRALDRLVIVVNPLPRDRVAAEARELESFLESRLGIDVEIYFPTSTCCDH